LNGLAEVQKFNNLHAVDVENLLHCILYGWGIEVYSFDPVAKMLKIRAYDPRDWFVLYDANDEPVLAIYKVIRPAGSYNSEDETLTEDERTEFYIYDAVSVRHYIEAALVEEISHEFGILPVVVYAASADRQSFVSQALISQQDTYNKIRSRNADDLEYNVDALLKIIGMEPNAMFEKDANGESWASKMRELRILPLPLGADAGFLTKGNQKESVEYDLNLAREAIHIMGRIADIAQIVGAVGQTSGIALKLKLQAQIEQAGIFTTYFEMGLRKRIALYNAISSKLGFPELLHFAINYSLNIPVNEIEIWQYLAGLDTELALEDRIKLIPSISDPAKAAEAKRMEDSIAVDKMVTQLTNADMGIGNVDTGSNSVSDNSNQDVQA
jgi:SPP1 family phage portal protein